MCGVGCGVGVGVCGVGGSGCRRVWGRVRIRRHVADYGAVVKSTNGSGGAVVDRAGQWWIVQGSAHIAVEAARGQL